MKNNKDIILHSGGLIVLLFSQWLISVLLVRMGGFEEAGIFSLAMTISNVFAFVGNFGIRTYMLTRANGNEIREQYKGACYIAILLSYVACFIYLLLAGHYSIIEHISILLYLTYNNINSYSEILFGEMQLEGHLEVNGKSNIIRGCCCFCSFCVAFLLFHNMIVSLLFMALSSATVMLGVDARKYRHIVKKSAFDFKWQTKQSYKILYRCLPIMMTMVLPLITTAIPRDTIQRIFGTEMLGYFSSVFAPMVIITTIVSSIMQGILPRLSSEWETRPLSFLREVLLCIGACVLFMLIIEALALLTGDKILLLLFGEKILPYYSLLLWAILVTGLSAITGVVNNALIIMGRNFCIIYSNMLSLTVCLIISETMIRREQLIGGATTLVIAYGVQFLLGIGQVVWGYRRKTHG